VGNRLSLKNRSFRKFAVLSVKTTPIFPEIFRPDDNPPAIKSSDTGR
jgi:hypothetical protein